MPKRVYLNRTLTKEIEDISDNFKALLVTGPRQIGKTTLLKQIADTNRKYVSLDTKSDLLLAKSDPQGFLDLYQPPVLIDEIQYAPELFPYIKLFLDNADEKGLIWMTGSQQYNMMKNVTESLAGRIAIVNMLGLSLYEIEGIGEQQLPFKPSDNTMIRNILTKKGSTETFEIIWRGSFPEIIAKSPKRVKNFYESYVRTYIPKFPKISN